ncbi:histidine-phosphotransfer domain, HPT domain-containing protein [Mycena galericulata]|nr:histidine-phosphotransfer domain, HPT domain-containing protein [Mycena galericulata]
MAVDDPVQRRSTPPPKLDPVPDPPAPKADTPATPRTPSETPSEPHPANATPAPPSAVKPVNLEIFGQILELDEEGTHDFSKEMVAAYFSQAETTFTDMDNALVDKKLPRLHELGHFLKGSSAALGISKVQAACEKMQHYGELRDEEAGKDLSAADALTKIEALLIVVKAEYAEAETWLKEWYADHKESFDEP